MLLGRCLSRILLPVRRKRRPKAKVSTPQGRGPVLREDIGTFEEAVQAGRVTDWLAAHGLQEKSEKLERDVTGSDCPK